MNRLLLLLLFMISCEQKEIRKLASVENNVRETIRLEFEKDLNVNTSDYKNHISFINEKRMPWVDDPKGQRRAHGWCFFFGDYIFINKQHWAKIDIHEKRELIYHELGHCVLNLGHNDDISVMNPFPPSTSYWVSSGISWEFLVKELRERYEQR